MDSESTLEIDEFGNKWWKNKDGKIHRLDGPAIEFTDGYKEWWFKGRIHREDGPAVIFPTGEKNWWLNRINYQTKEDWFDALSNEGKAKCLFSEDFLNG